MSIPTESVGAMTAPCSPPPDAQESKRWMRLVPIRPPQYRIRHNPSRSLSYPWRIERRQEFLFFFWIWEDVDGATEPEIAEKDLKIRILREKLTAQVAAQRCQIFLYDKDGNRI